MPWEVPFIERVQRINEEVQIITLEGADDEEHRGEIFDAYQTEPTLEAIRELNIRLRDIGAQVIKMESADLPANRDPSRGIYPDMNRNKLSCTIDLRNDGGKALFKRLASVSDIVVDNFSAGVMDRLGVGYQALKYPCYVHPLNR